MAEIIKKKRGRKPKLLNLILSNKEVQSDINEIISSEEEKIILHLPISETDINKNKNNELSIFIKNEKELLNNNINLKKIKMAKEEELCNSLIKEKNNTSSEINVNSHTSKINNIMNTDKMIYSNVNKIMTHTLVFNKNTKCWWCRNTFTSPSVQLPEDYHNETFYCIGNFCSFNCCKSYNLDMNDSLIWKRESLINLLYYQTYSEFKHINVAPHWITLSEYGGTLSIEKFRENSIINVKEYLILHPPLISREMQIEESYKFNKLKEVSINVVNKMYSETNYNIKRNKPVQSTQLNLETTMGLIKNKKNR